MKIAPAAIEWNSMKCPTCKKDFEKGVKAAYRLGRLENRFGPTMGQLDAYVLVIAQGKTHVEAGKELGISRSAVTRRISRFLSHIR